MSGIDIGVIVGYFIVTTFVGLYLSKKAAGSIDEYFLGGRSIPWFILGISGMATYVDMSGTMLQVSFFYMLGVKGYLVAYRGAVALSLAFLMIFMAKWMNRSGVMTIAEWMEFRFGKGVQGRIARLLSAIATLVMAIAFIAYFFVGSGKFLSLYLPFLTPRVSAAIFFAIVLVYTVASGFYGVVYTDVLQSLLIIGVIVFTAVKAFSLGTPEYFAANADADWLKLIPSSWEVSMPAGYESMKFLSVLVLFWIVSNVFQGFAQPYDAWTSQRYFAAKNEHESSLVAGQWIALFGLRFCLMMGLGVLAIGITSKISEPEMALPAVIEHYMPVGLKGVFIAALIAAAMSTLDSTINSSAAYFVKDIYKLYIKPDADTKHLIKVSYVTTFAIVILGAVIGCAVPNINSIWGWIVMGLVTGMLPPNIIKWFWWRFNGTGYAFGMGFGILSAVIHRAAFGDAPEYVTFSIVMIISTIGTIIGAFCGKATDMDVLVNFYKKTRPFGFWGPVRRACEQGFVEDVKKENKRDLLLLVPACVWQCTWFLLMTAVVVKKWNTSFVCAVILAVFGWVLYKYWYKNLKKC